MPRLVAVMSNAWLRRQPGEHADDDTDDGGKEGAGADQDQRRHD